MLGIAGACVVLELLPVEAFGGTGTTAIGTGSKEDLERLLEEKKAEKPVD